VLSGADRSQGIDSSARSLAARDQQARGHPRKPTLDNLQRLVNPTAHERARLASVLEVDAAVLFDAGATIEVRTSGR
jgi:hypothetical protein